MPDEDTEQDSTQEVEVHRRWRVQLASAYGALVVAVLGDEPAGYDEARERLGVLCRLAASVEVDSGLWYRDGEGGVLTTTEGVVGAVGWPALWSGMLAALADGLERGTVCPAAPAEEPCSTHDGEYVIRDTRTGGEA